MFKQNRNLLIISLIAVVNALGYGIVFPILYSYSQKYGLTDFQNGLLFATYSVFQFISTPIIGRMSDKFGRRPLLVTSIFGTAASFFLMAFAPNAVVLFFARALDGATAGNFSVASAVISDTTPPQHRAKGFGILGASFGIGMIFGPAIAALSQQFSLSAPFIIAGFVSLAAAVITAMWLPETNLHRSEVSKSPIFDFRRMVSALTDKNVGATLLITLLYATAFSLFIYAFQPYTVKNLSMNAQQISLVFVMFGFIGLLAQLFIIPKTNQLLGPRKALFVSLIGVAVSFALMFFLRTAPLFVTLCVVLGLANSLVNPLVQTVLSRETDAKSQGSIMGLNFSYMSIGQVVGPIGGGFLATYSLGMPFLFAGLLTAVCLALSTRINLSAHKESAFA